MNILLKDSMEIPTLKDCEKLVAENECFFCCDEVVDNTPIKSFNYRIALPKDFNQKYARNMRGIGFNANTSELIFLPLHKFFNFEENEFTLKSIVSTWGKPKTITEKFDGSLIIFYMLNNKLFCRTQGNAFSEQAVWAMEIVNKNIEFKNSIISDILNGFTPMFEFVSFRNRIVVLYNDEKLMYIGHRNMTTGEFDRDTNKFKQFGIDSVTSYDVNTMSVKDLINVCKSSKENREGFVVEFNNGEMIKMKTEQYFTLHKTKSDLLNDSNIVELTLKGEIDDILPKLEFDGEFKKHIEDIRNKTVEKFRNLHIEADKFFEANKNLSKKEFAIKGLKELDKTIFNLSMAKFDGKKNEDKFISTFIKNKMWED